MSIYGTFLDYVLRVTYNELKERMIVFQLYNYAAMSPDEPKLVAQFIIT